ncbi:glutamate receptor 2.9-like, partial [Hyalella azteca]|uniref:Glutamate receptor 2.9-like n=1 Tax=Hyalella azteca TaxID=294128 RepID=A0A979FJ42_HYAAZ
NYALTQPDYVLGKMWKKRTDYQPDAKNVITTALKDKVAVIAPEMIHLGLMTGDFSEFGECRLALCEANLIPPVYMTYGYPKNSPLQVRFDIMLLRVVQSGIANHLISSNLWNSTWCMKPSNSLSESRPLVVTDFLGLFSIYGIGMAFSVLVFIIEVATGRKAKSKINT